MRAWLPDLLVIAGMAALGAGLWLWWPPAALMVCGVLLLAMGVFGAWQKR
jgi:hypothetical protein